MSEIVFAYVGALLYFHPWLTDALEGQVHHVSGNPPDASLHLEFVDDVIDPTRIMAAIVQCSAAAASVGSAESYERLAALLGSIERGLERGDPELNTFIVESYLAPIAHRKGLAKVLVPLLGAYARERFETL